MRKQLQRYDRSRIETDRAARQEIAPAHGDEVRRSPPGADEMYRPGAGFDCASAQVTTPTVTRCATSCAPLPAAASAAASATEPTPVSASTRGDFVAIPWPAASSSGCAIVTNGTPSAAA